MELIVDNEPRSMTAKIINSYSRANLKVIELSKFSVQVLSANLPILSSANPIKTPLSIYTEITRISKTSALLYGDSCLDKAQTSSWVELANTIAAKDFIEYLEKKLISRTFLVSNHVTLADIAAFAVVQKEIGGVTLQEKDKFPCIMRWASHLVTLPGLKNNLPMFEIPFKVNKLMESFENILKQGKSEVEEKKVEEKPKKIEEKPKNNEQPEGKKKPAEDQKKKKGKELTEEEKQKKIEENKKRAEENKKKGEAKKAEGVKKPKQGKKGVEVSNP